MTKNKIESTKKPFYKAFLPYFLSLIVISGIVFVGAANKTNYSADSLNMESLASNNFSSVSTDQLSEFYVVATLADSMKLASSETVASNYVTVSVMKNAGQNSTDKIEKPTITDTSHLARCGVNNYTFAEGETMESVANKYGISTDQIRWSNKLKTTSVQVGQTLLIPGTSGIVYNVKTGDTIESVAAKYGSTTDEIIACNDLETNKNLTVGVNIVLPNGSLPENERPEYVAPVRRPASYSYTYSGSSSSRLNIRTVATGFYDSRYAYPNPNPGVSGWCTWYAWYWRATDSRSLGTLGHEGRNANTWHINYSYRGVGKTPKTGAVFQTPYGGGGYGHVGVVLSVNGDNTITVREMNYAGRYVVTEAEIPSGVWQGFNFIY